MKIINCTEEWQIQNFHFFESRRKVRLSLLLSWRWGWFRRTWSGTTSWPRPWRACATIRQLRPSSVGERRSYRPCRGRRRSPYRRYRWRGRTWYPGRCVPGCRTRSGRYRKSSRDATRIREPVELIEIRLRYSRIGIILLIHLTNKTEELKISLHFPSNSV